MKSEGSRKRKQTVRFDDVCESECGLVEFDEDNGSTTARRDFLGMTDNSSDVTLLFWQVLPPISAATSEVSRYQPAAAKLYAPKLRQFTEIARIFLSSSIYDGVSYVCTFEAILKQRFTTSSTVCSLASNWQIFVYSDAEVERSRWLAIKRSQKRYRRTYREYWSCKAPLLATLKASLQFLHEIPAPVSKASR